MLKDLLNNPYFNIVFSFVLGLGIISICRPVCVGDKCNTAKAPPTADWNNSVYEMSSKCYEYKTRTIDCPSTGLVESFEGTANKRKSILL
jgi:hypothetical protein